MPRRLPAAAEGQQVFTQQAGEELARTVASATARSTVRMRIAL
ncbi:hypothetical protein ACPWT1_21410 [Ramlibacter sp. MMS24-I3-19]